LARRFNLLDESALEAERDGKIHQKGRREHSGSFAAGTLDTKPPEASQGSAGKAAPFSGPGVRSEHPASSHPETEMDTERKSGSRFWLWLLFLVVIAAVVAYFLYFQPKLKVNYHWPDFQIVPSGGPSWRKAPAIEITQHVDSRPSPLYQDLAFHRRGGSPLYPGEIFAVWCSFVCVHFNSSWRDWVVEKKRFLY